MERKRLFIAADISATAREKISDVIKKMRVLAEREHLRVSWVLPENLHITMKFLGGTEVEKIDTIVAALEECARGKSPFEVHSKIVGAFPSASNPRVLWAGLEDKSNTLAKIASEVDLRMEALGFDRDTREYSPHITVGRVKEGRGGPKVIAPFQTLDFDTFTIKDIVLYESQTKAGGSVYTTVRRIPFTG